MGDVVTVSGSVDIDSRMKGNKVEKNKLRKLKNGQARLSECQE